MRSALASDLVFEGQGAAPDGIRRDRRRSTDRRQRAVFRPLVRANRARIRAARTGPLRRERDIGDWTRPRAVRIGWPTRAGSPAGAGTGPRRTVLAPVLPRHFPAARDGLRTGRGPARNRSIRTGVAANDRRGPAASALRNSQYTREAPAWCQVSVLINFSRKVVGVPPSVSASGRSPTTDRGRKCTRMPFELRQDSRGAAPRLRLTAGAVADDLRLLRGSHDRSSRQEGDTSLRRGTDPRPEPARLTLGPRRRHQLGRGVAARPRGPEVAPDRATTGTGTRPRGCSLSAASPIQARRPGRVDGWGDLLDVEEPEGQPRRTRGHSSRLLATGGEPPGLLRLGERPPHPISPLVGFLHLVIPRPWLLAVRPFRDHESPASRRAPPGRSPGSRPSRAPCRPAPRRSGPAPPSPRPAPAGPARRHPAAPGEDQGDPPALVDGGDDLRRGPPRDRPIAGATAPPFWGRLGGMPVGPHDGRVDHHPHRAPAGGLGGHRRGRLSSRRRPSEGRARGRRRGPGRGPPRRTSGRELGLRTEPGPASFDHRPHDDPQLVGYGVTDGRRGTGGTGGTVPNSGSLLTSDQPTAWPVDTTRAKTSGGW